MSNVNGRGVLGAPPSAPARGSKESYRSGRGSASASRGTNNKNASGGSGGSNNNNNKNVSGNSNNNGNNNSSNNSNNSGNNNTNHGSPLSVPSTPQFISAGISVAARKRDAKRRANRRQYAMDMKVGEGTYGVVYLARDPTTQMPVAVKRLKATKDGQGISPTACREITLLRELNHENIVTLEDVYLDPNERSLSLVFTYADHDVFEIIKHHQRSSKRIEPQVVKSLMWQILNGINYLHSNWIIHRDIKPSNILVMGKGREEGVVKIADFGLARIFRSPLRPLSDDGIVVTIWYRAPELLLGAKHYTEAIDVWAIGCIFAELLTAYPLFPGKDNTNSLFQQDQIERIIKILGSPTPARWPDVITMPDFPKIQSYLKEVKPNLLHKHIGNCGATKNALNLLSQMIDYDPLRRITAAEALEHDYFKEAPVAIMNSIENQSYQIRDKFQSSTSSSSSSNK
eukprot:TRINITY_DN214_c0_g4_i1.p1 TRINITY_DN214_c0_g4~~TRINITY_DN214_c0_g4_i1.p1  ORF type:complete len:457 (+),score=128.67 TRINITY_DN214_c0_g4_i1:455-1825(+)